MPFSNEPVANILKYNIRVRWEVASEILMSIGRDAKSPRYMEGLSAEDFESPEELQEYEAGGREVAANILSAYYDVEATMADLGDAIAEGEDYF